MKGRVCEPVVTLSRRKVDYWCVQDTIYYGGHGCIIKVVWDPCQKITLLLLKSKSVRVIVPESCF